MSELRAFGQDGLSQHGFRVAFQAMIGHDVHRAGAGAVADDVQETAGLDSAA